MRCPHKETFSSLARQLSEAGLSATAGWWKPLYAFSCARISIKWGGTWKNYSEQFHFLVKLKIAPITRQLKSAPAFDMSRNHRKPPEGSGMKHRQVGSNHHKSRDCLSFPGTRIRGRSKARNHDSALVCKELNPAMEIMIKCMIRGRWWTQRICNSNRTWRWRRRFLSSSSRVSLRKLLHAAGIN